MKIRQLVSLLWIGFLFSIGRGQTSLADYQQIAGENNPGLQAHYKRVEASMQIVKQVGALPDPNLSFGYFLSPIETRVGPQVFRMSLSQMFPWFGTLKTRENAANLRSEAQYQSLIDARNKLYFDVASAYFPLYELEQTLQLQRENLKLLESYKKIANQKFENAKGTLVDVLRVDIMINEALTEIEILEAKRKPFTVKFNILLNRETTTELTIVDTLPFSDRLSTDNRDSTWVNHPKLQSLKLKQEAMKTQKELAQKQGLPSFGINLDYLMIGLREASTPGTELSISENGRDAFATTATMSIPLFRGKYNSAQKEAAFMQEVYQKSEIETRNRLLADYENTLFELGKSRKQLDLYQNQIQEIERASKLLLTSYANERQEFEELLELQQQLLQYKTLRVSAITAIKMAEAKLNYITAQNQ